LAHQLAAEQGEKYKTSFHKFTIGQNVWLSDTISIGKNAELSPNWIGPYKIVDINDNNVKFKIKNKLKVTNIARIKLFVKEAPKCLFEKDLCSSQGDQCLSQGDPGLFLDQQNHPPSRPLTSAFKKINQLKRP
jgi:hypothetical protein